MLNKILHTFFTKGLGAGVNFFTAVLLSRYLGPEGRGEASLFVATVFMINVFTHFLSGSTLVYYASRYRTIDLLFRAYAWCMLVAGVGSVLAASVYPQLAVQGVDLFFVSLLQGLFMANVKLLTGKEKVTTANTVLAVQALILAVALSMAFFYFQEYSLVAYITALYFSFGIGALLSFYLLLPGAGEGQKITEMKSLTGKGFWNTVDNAALIFNQRLNLFFIESYVSKAGVGIYANAYAVGEVIMMAVMSICMVQYAKVANSANDKENRKLTQKWALVAIGFTFSALMVAFLIPAWVYGAVFGSEFVAMKNLILILGPGLLIFSYAQVINHYFSGMGHYRLMAFISGIGCLILVLSAPLLIARYGAAGAAGAMSISLISASCISVYRYYFQQKKA